MTSRTIYEYRIPGSALVFRWYVNDVHRQIPVFLTPTGDARLLNGPDDDLALAAILDALLEARERGLYPAAGINKDWAARVPRNVISGEGRWNQPLWDEIVFSKDALDISYCRKAVEASRREAEARRSREQNTQEIGGEKFYYFDSEAALQEHLQRRPSCRGEFRGPGWYGILTTDTSRELVPAPTLRAVLVAKRDALQALIDALDLPPTWKR